MRRLIDEARERVRLGHHRHAAGRAADRRQPARLDGRRRHAGGAGRARRRTTWCKRAVERSGPSGCSASCSTAPTAGACDGYGYDYYGSYHEPTAPPDAPRHDSTADGRLLLLVAFETVLIVVGRGRWRPTCVCRRRRRGSASSRTTGHPKRCCSSGVTQALSVLRRPVRSRASSRIGASCSSGCCRRSARRRSSWPPSTSGFPTRWSAAASS